MDFVRHCSAIFVRPKAVAEILNADDPIPINEGIRGFEIAVDNTAGVEIPHCEGYSRHNDCHPCPAPQDAEC
jgi:hypothetical protein